jgi:hypothetical protein
MQNQQSENYSANFFYSKDCEPTRPQNPKAPLIAATMDIGLDF